MSRDRDVRNAIHDALVATSAFDGVWIHGLPEEYGGGCGQVAAAAIEPESSTQEDPWDGGTETSLVVTSRVTLTLLYRDEDPQLRDEGVELLLNTAANALNGQSLAGFTIPDQTKIVQWRWERPTPPERRIKATVSYQYIVGGWADYDVES